MERAVITVLGHDKVGIIANICTYLAGANINILDISQTILQGFFSMMMVVDVSGRNRSFDDLINELNELGEGIGMQIKIQHEEIFNTMHRI